ncbi:TniB family NTP-binding protein [Paracoccus sp. MA]|uniref:TniB family NTP-binding protein n=1 Tax=Paracoccus sp. MA TaxID=2895796 RepID=UPI001E6109D8|nr:TniB family NTP-binding protein [Paracoccus sp. MA]UFM64676.1 TniB family NTP-binding protein [Paracoccus sp. MA]
MPDPAATARILEKLRKLRIDTPRDAAFRSHFDRLLRRDEAGNLLHEPQRFSAERETRGVMVIDGAGGGKTTLIDHALARHPALAGAGTDGRHYLEASVPSPATFKSMAGALLHRSGYPVNAAHREGWSLWETLRGRLKDLDITTLWIDEAHDLFCADRNLILRAIKAIMQGDEAVVVILSGTENLREIIRSDPQVQRRFSTLNLPPVAVATDGANFREVIAAYCRIAGLEQPLEADLIPRLFHAARYRFGRCVETILGAIEFALEGDASRLDIGHFAEFWGLQEGCPLGGNVFLAPDWPQIDPDQDEADDRPVSVRARRRRK